MLGDIRSARLIYFKAVLFLVLGGTASALILIERPSLRVAGLLALAVWAFARAYYFAFYVIEHYVDRDFQFAGLWSVARYLLRRGGRPNRPDRVAGDSPGATDDARPEIGP